MEKKINLIAKKDDKNTRVDVFINKKKMISVEPGSKI